MFKSGKFVSKHVTKSDGSTVSEDRIQTHGVELTIDKIYRLRGNAFISNDGYVKPRRVEVDATNANVEYDESNAEENQVKQDIVNSKHYMLAEGAYVVQYGELVSIPDDHVGFVLPRSRLMRSGLHLTTAVWESGYNGIGEGGLDVNQQTFIKEDTKIGQFVLARASVFNQYDGSHQGENIDE